jgi:hypothetical protein
VRNLPRFVRLTVEAIRDDDNEVVATEDAQWLRAEGESTDKSAVARSEREIAARIGRTLKGAGCDDLSPGLSDYKRKHFRKPQ